MSKIIYCIKRVEGLNQALSYETVFPSKYVELYSYEDKNNAEKALNKYNKSRVNSAYWIYIKGILYLHEKIKENVDRIVISAQNLNQLLEPHRIIDDSMTSFVDTLKYTSTLSYKQELYAKMMNFMITRAEEIWRLYNPYMQENRYIEPVSYFLEEINQEDITCSLTII